MNEEAPVQPAPDTRGETWHALPVETVLVRQGSGPDGLSPADAEKRLDRWGHNILPRRRPPSIPWIYVRQFANPLVYLLLAATVVSVAVGEWLDAGFIFVVLQLNAVIGVAQEWKAQKEAEALDALIRDRAVVRREGHWVEVDAAELVPGDILRLESGDRIGADLRLLEHHELTVDESLLTGESLPVAKQPDAVHDVRTPVAERANMLHAGCTILKGRAQGVVVATGRRTEIGRIAEALATGPASPPPLIRRLEHFSRRLGIVTMVLIAVIAVAQLLQGTPLITVFLIAVALAVAAIPEGLPVAITIALAVATHRMQKRRVIVRALPAVEGLGTCTVIASDKTGTLTCNELMVRQVLTFSGSTPDPAIQISGAGYGREGAPTSDGKTLTGEAESRFRALVESAALCNEATVRFTAEGTEHLGDTVDVAFLVAATKAGIDVHELRRNAPQVSAIPYEPARRFAAAFAVPARSSDQPEAPGDGAVVHVKGAPEVILPLCSGSDAEQLRVEADRMAAQGYRVLAVARGPATLEEARAVSADALSGLTFLGLAGLIDPVRPEVPEAIERCRMAGISVRMVTGDHPGTALAIARELGIASDPREVVTGAELARHDRPDDHFDRRVAEARVFARVEPVQKLDIVAAYQRGGEVVAVTGDGVNDAPALDAADIGVAMGLGGTDVARGAADLILTDDNFASIVAGIEEGRVAYDNVRKLIFLLVATGLGEIVLFLLAIVFDRPIPLFAVQLLWLNLVTNGIQHMALAFEKAEPDIGKRPPRPPGEALFDRRMVSQVLTAGTYMGAMAFVFFEWCLTQGMAEAEARNMVLLLMVLFENAHVLNARSERRSVFQVPLSDNWFLVLAVVGAQGLHIAAMHLPGLRTILDVQPISWTDWLTVAMMAVSLIVVIEIYKRVMPVRVGR